MWLPKGDMNLFISTHVDNIVHWIVPVLVKDPGSTVGHKRKLKKKKTHTAESQLDVIINVTQLLSPEIEGGFRKS